MPQHALKVTTYYVARANNRGGTIMDTGAVAFIAGVLSALGLLAGAVLLLVYHIIPAPFRSVAGMGVVLLGFIFAALGVLAWRLDAEMRRAATYRTAAEVARRELADAHRGEVLAGATAREPVPATVATTTLPDDADEAPPARAAVAPTLRPEAYNRPHVFAADMYDGESRCICGRREAHMLHIFPGEPHGD